MNRGFDSEVKQIIQEVLIFNIYSLFNMVNFVTKIYKYYAFLFMLWVKPVELINSN